jgi:hypothetical protein
LMITREAWRRIKDLILQEGQQRTNQFAMKERKPDYQFQVWWSLFYSAHVSCSPIWWSLFYSVHGYVQVESLSMAQLKLSSYVHRVRWSSAHNFTLMLLIVSNISLHQC